MENKDQTQPTTPPEGATTPPPQVTPVAPPTDATVPTAAVPPTPPPPIATAPVVAPPSPGKKNNGLWIVAFILVTLIIVLGALYYIIMKQSTGQPAKTTPPVQQQVIQPTTPPVTPTVTPTDEEILLTPVPNPDSDSTQLNTDIQGL